jgi:hypothetical protein
MAGLVESNLEGLLRASGVRVPRASAVAPQRLLTEVSGGASLLKTADGRTVRLGSARDPRREAEALIASAFGSAPVPDATAVLGAGTGAVLEALERMPVRRILVIEPDAELAFAWLSRRSWLDLIQANRLRLVVGPDYVGAAEAAGFLERVDRLPVITHPVLAREYSDEMAAARRALDRIVRGALANANARHRFEDIALVNTLRNLPLLASGADVAALFGRFSHAPAVVVGAGPSLDDNLAAIVEAQDRALVIATDTALLPCLKAGVVPTLVIALDPSEENGRHLIGCAAATETHLVAEASVEPAAVDAFAGRTFMFRVGDHAPWPWLLSSGVSRARLSVWGSVATAALDLALKAGCPAVALTGLDLAYTAGRPYCRGTVFEEGWAWAVARGQTLQEHWELLASTRPVVDEPDVGGHLVSSGPHLLAFRNWIRETVVAHPHVRFANATGAGILHGPHIVQQPLADFLVGYAAVGRSAFVSSVRSVYSTARTPRTGPHLAAQLARTRPLDVVGGHSAADRVANDFIRPELLYETVRRLETSQPDDSARAEPSVTFAAGPRIHLPEQTAILCALTFGAHIGAPPAREGARERALAILDEAYSQLVALMPHAYGVHSPHQANDLVTLWHRVPARLLFAWPRGLADAVDAFGSRLAEAIRLVGEDRRLPNVDVPPAADGLWCESAIDPARPADLGLEPQLAPATLVWQWSVAYALTMAPDSFFASTVAKLMHAPPALVPANRPATRLTAWLTRPESAGATTLLPWLPEFSTARAISGLVATSRPVVDHRERDVTLRVSLSNEKDPLAAVCTLEPESLMARGHPPAHVVARLSVREVLVGRSDGSGIAVMSESGELVRVETWPLPVRASIPHGEHGRLAWHFPDSPRMLHRDLATGQLDVIELPCTVFDALERPDGSVCLATDDGLWAWRSGRSAQPIVRGPWLVSLSAHGEGLQARVRPPRTPDGRWEATTVIFEWQPGEPAFRTTAVAPGTAPFSVATHAGWRAEAWLDSSVIRLERRDGRVFWLACSGPRSLAWAGATLYVATAAGEVLWFRDLATRLTTA